MSKKYKLKCCLTITIEGVAEAKDKSDVTAEVNLYNILLNDSVYSPSVRPALNPSESILVQLEAELFSLDGIVRIRFFLFFLSKFVHV